MALVVVNLNARQSIWGWGVSGLGYLGLLPVLFMLLLPSVAFAVPTLSPLAQHDARWVYGPERTSEFVLVQAATHEACMAVLARRSQSLSTAELVTDLLGDIPLQPASLDMIRAAEARLGMALPEDLVNLYQIHNGLPAMKLPPVETLGNTPVDQLWKAQREQGLGPRYQGPGTAGMVYPVDAKMIYVGGFQGDETMSSLYLYNPETGGGWYACSVKEGRTVCVAVIYTSIWKHLLELWFDLHNRYCMKDAA